MKRLYCIILSLILFSFSYGDNEYTAYIKRVNSIGTFIGDTTQGVEYNYSRALRPRNNGNALEDDYFIKEDKAENSKIIMTLDKIQLLEGRPKYYFPINSDNKLDEMKLKVTGRINLKNGIENLVGTERIKIGDIQEKNHKRGVYLTFDYSILKKRIQ